MINSLLRLTNLNRSKLWTIGTLLTRGKNFIPHVGELMTLCHLDRRNRIYIKRTILSYFNSFDNNVTNCPLLPLMRHLDGTTCGITIILCVTLLNGVNDMKGVPQDLTCEYRSMPLTLYLRRKTNELGNNSVVPNTTNRNNNRRKRLRANIRDNILLKICTILTRRILRNRMKRTTLTTKRCSLTFRLVPNRVVIQLSNSRRKTIPLNRLNRRLNMILLTLVMRVSKNLQSNRTSIRITK